MKLKKNYREKNGTILQTFKLKGKYFNDYGNGALAGPYKNQKEAKTMVLKHRPTAKKIKRKV